MTSKSIKNWCVIHKWTSLVSTVFILIACISGLPLIFHEEIDQLEKLVVGEKMAFDANAPQTVLSIDTLISKVEELRPDRHLQLLFREPSDPGVTSFSMGASLGGPIAESEFLRIDNISGNYLGSQRVGEGIMGFLFVLHTELLVGFPGTLFLGLMTIIMLLAIISGVVLYAPFMRNRSFAVVRVNKGRHTRWFDLHNALGIVLLVWLFVVSVTGAINTLGNPMIQFWLLNDLKELIADDEVGIGTPDTELASIQSAIDLATKEIPDGELYFATYPGTELSSDRHYLIFFTGNTPVSSRMFKTVVINAYSGELIAQPDLPWYLNALLLSQPLHFGDYGGLGLKIMWALLDIATIILLWSGLVLWWRKRREVPEIDLISPDIVK